MRGKIDINQVEADTKIHAKYLRAMENEEWELLPGEIYAKTLLRTYADYLGLDSRELVDDYRREHERPTDHDLRPLSSGRDRERRPGGRRRQPAPPGGRGFPIPPWTIVVLVLAIVGVALYLVGKAGNNNNSNGTSAAHKSAHHKHKAKHGQKQAPKHHKAAPTSVHLKLVPTGSVYVCLVNAKGHPLIPGTTLSAGQSVPVQVAKTLLLTLGNNSVTLTANGKKVPLAPSSSPIGIKFTPHGHSSLPAANQPQCT